MPRDGGESVTADLQNSEQAIALQPHSPEAYVKRGVILAKQMRYEDAIASFNNAIQIKPGIPHAYNSRGNSLQAVRRFEEAIESYDQAIALKPDYALAYVNRGNALQSLKRDEEAVANYTTAIVLNPELMDAYNNRGAVFRRYRLFNEALADFDKAVALSPECAELHNNRGNALQQLELFEQALESYDTAVSLNPGYAEAYGNRGVVLRELGCFDDAIESFNKALALKPNHHEAIWNRALAHLQTGRFDVGWRGYEARKRRREPVGYRSLEKPVWLGETDISGQTVLVYGEQGLGDVIQFSRYLKLLDDAGGTVLFAPRKELRSLMRGLDARPRLVDLKTETPQFDVHCPLLSLPLAFKTDISTIPSEVYLSADRQEVMRWRTRLGDKSAARIGVVWKGSQTPDSSRSIGLDYFGRLLDPRVQFVSLQKDATDAERAWLDRAGVLHVGDEIAEFSDTAALCVLMDLVISVDTSVAHLAGALGVPVWVLLKAVADWRWLLDREDSPWYPSMRLFRQKTRGDWDSVLRQVEREIKSGFLSSQSGQ